MLVYDCKQCGCPHVFGFVNEFDEHFCSIKCYEIYCGIHGYEVHKEYLRDAGIK